MKEKARVLPVFLRRITLPLGVALAALACLFALWGAPASEEIPVVPETPEPTAAPILFYARTDGVRCYREPTEDEEQFLGTMKAGAVVSLLEERDGFARVRWNDGELWCRAWYLAAQDPELEAARDASRLEALRAEEGYEAFETPETRVCMSYDLNCREEPNTDSEVLGVLGYGDTLTAYGHVENFSLVRLEDGRLCWCASNYLAGDEQCAVYPGAIDLRALLPLAQFDLLFASENNVTGRALYPAVPLLEENTAYRLLRAYNVFLDDGFILKVYDAYRPMSAQVALYDVVRDSRFIANPARWGSWHNRGRAVDISLVNFYTGEELEMPTPMHTFATSASRSSSGRWSTAARSNVDYMTGVMEQCGFSKISTEWWHFEYTGGGPKLPTEIDYGELTYKHITEYFD